MGARLGQHFLFDPTILSRIADAAVRSPDDVVLEIGPGRGTLTRELATRASRVVAIETDRRLATQLTEWARGSNVTILAGDALRMPWPSADVIAGNIPYQITSPLIERALTPPRPKRVVFLVQREVADRLAAEPGSKAYGALSAGVQLVAAVERLFSVKAGAFRPPPRVQSALVRLTPRELPLATREEEPAARELIRALFQRRRQQLQRSLKEATGRADAAEILHGLGIEPAARAEELAPESFVAIARVLARP